MVEGIDRDRLSVVTGGLLLALALARLLDVPGRPLQVNVLGSALGFDLSETTVLFVAIAGMAATGVEALLRAHPRVSQEDRTAVFWIVPALLSLALASWLNRIPDVGFWTLGLFAAALLIPLAMVAEYAAVTPALRRDSWLQWSYSVLVHLVALILFAVIYDARWRGLVGAPLLFISALLLASRLFWTLTRQARQAVLYGVVCALPVSQLLLVVNYWPLSGLQGGLALLLGFYVMVGLLQHYLRAGRLERQVVVEYVAVALVGIIATLLLIP